MKIIGIGDNKYICEIDNDEMTQVMGTDNLYDFAEDLSPGSEVSLHRVINATRWVRNLNEDHVEDVIRHLNTVLHGMDKVKDTVHSLTLFSKLSEKEVE